MSSTSPPSSPPKQDAGYAASLRAYHQTLQAQILKEIWEPSSQQPGAPAADDDEDARRRGRSSTTRRSYEGRRRAVPPPPTTTASAPAPPVLIRRRSSNPEASSSGGGAVHARRPSAPVESFSHKERRARLAEGEAVKRIRRQGFRQDSQDKVGSLRSLATRAPAALTGDEDVVVAPSTSDASSPSSCPSSSFPPSPRSDDDEVADDDIHRTPNPAPKPTFSRNVTSESIVTIRSSASTTMLDPYYLGEDANNGGVSDSDESFAALAPSPMWTPALGSVAHASLRSHRHLMAGRPSPENLHLHLPTVGAKSMPSPLRIETTDDASETDVASLRHSLAMSSIVESEAATPACEAPAAYANNPRAPRVCMTAVSQSMRQQDSSSSSSSSGDGRLTRRCTFQRPHHKNGRGKGRGGSWTEEVDLEVRV